MQIREGAVSYIGGLLGKHGHHLTPKAQRVHLVGYSCAKAYLYKHELIHTDFLQT